MQCSACKEDIKATLFKPQQIRNYYKDQGILCHQCHAQGCTIHDTGKYECTGCKHTFGRQKFNATHFKSFMAGLRSFLMCETCSTREADRDRQLRNLMKKSTRAGCKCGSKLQHCEKCPMHPRTSGERPYPYCDVMSRDDSEWILKRR